MTRFSPTRQEALRRLDAFVPRSGRDYAAGRNYDLGPDNHVHVSQLSPYLRHRLITEGEVLQAVLGRYALSTAQKFVQEVYWRTYWKGWLEMRPSVWTEYRSGVIRALDRVHTEAGLRADWEAACKGETGLAGFDEWARELVETGYLHNHARMWFASMWIFTLRLPWELGADFFLRHLLDGDPASNTLGWRWVAGLQTRGKTYLARAANITRYTEGRIRPDPHELAPFAEPLDGPPNPPRGALPDKQLPDPGAKTGYLLTEEDLSPAFAFDQVSAADFAVFSAASARSPLQVARQVTAFTDGAIDDCLTRSRAASVTRMGADAVPQALVDWASDRGLTQIVTPYAPIGPAAETLDRAEITLRDAGIALVRPLRDYDAAAWPHASAGFFKFKDAIPKLTGRIRGLQTA